MSFVLEIVVFSVNGDDLYFEQWKCLQTAGDGIASTRGSLH